MLFQYRAMRSHFIKLSTVIHFTGNPLFIVNIFASPLKEHIPQKTFCGLIKIEKTMKEINQSMEFYRLFSLFFMGGAAWGSQRIRPDS